MKQILIGIIIGAWLAIMGFWLGYTNTRLAKVEQATMQIVNFLNQKQPQAPQPAQPK